MSTTLDPGIKGYTQWRKALWRDDTLRDDAIRNQFDIRGTAEVIALHGANGRGCFASAATVAGYVGCSASLVKSHRKRLVDLGWFAVTGSRGRVSVLSIAVPRECYIEPNIYPECAECGGKHDPWEPCPIDTRV